MYALLTQLLDIPNYHVVSAEIETDKNTKDTLAQFATFLSVASRLIYALSEVDSFVTTATARSLNP